MIIGFGFQTFLTLCKVSSAMYNPSLCDYDIISTELFKILEKWNDIKVLYSVAMYVGSLQGWELSLVQTSIYCNQFSTLKNRDIQKVPCKLTSGHFVPHCTFHHQLNH